MAFTAEQVGVKGIEARHYWSLGGGLTFGDPSLWPLYKIRDTTVYDFPDIEDNSEPNTEAIGERPLPSYARARNVTYTIDVFGRDRPEMRFGGRELRRVFGPDPDTGLVQIGRMIVLAHTGFVELGDDIQHTFTGRCLQCSPGGDAQTRGPHSRPTSWGRSYVVGLRLYDPRIYEWDPLTETASNPAF